MKKIFLFALFCLIFSCNISDKKIYKNLYISNGGEFHDYPVASIKLESGDQINILPLEVEDYKIVNNYIFFKCIDKYNEEKFYFMDKNFDEYNFDQKISKPMSESEFKEYLKKKNIHLDW